MEIPEGYAKVRELQENVALCFHTATSEHHVLKFFPKSKQADFYTEKYLLTKLASDEIQGIVKYLASIETSSSLVLVTQYVESLSEEELIEQLMKMDESSKLKLCMKIAETIRRLHQVDVVHRDLKPGNILISKNLVEITVIDFAYSCCLMKNKKLIKGLGSMFFTSPEVIFMLPYDFKTDVWSLGICFLCFWFPETIIPLLKDESLAIKKEENQRFWKEFEKMVRIIGFEPLKPLAKLLQTECSVLHSIKPLLPSLETTTPSSKQMKEIIAKMLEVIPEKRASMEQVVKMLNGI